MEDPHELARFMAAQDGGQDYARVVSELRGGRKTSHWMWFIFPQITGLGHSELSKRYAISSLAEARAYLDHPVLGKRLRECAGVLLELDHLSAEDVLGSIDAIKLRSSMTLFDRAADDDAALFREVLRRFFAGQRDPATEERLGGKPA